MVLCRPNYLLGVLAKETSILQIASGGRFELVIGTGDYPKDFTAWNVPYPRRGNGWRSWLRASLRYARCGGAIW